MCIRDRYRYSHCLLCTDEENKPEIDINLSEDCEDELLGMSADNSSQGSTTHLVTKGGVVSEQGNLILGVHILLK